MVRQARMTLPPRLYVWKPLRSGGRLYPRGSVLLWRDEGITERRAMLLVIQNKLATEPWPGSDQVVEPEDLDVETGAQRVERDEREAKAKKESDDLDELRREKVDRLVKEGLTRPDAEDHVYGKLEDEDEKPETPDEDEDEDEDSDEEAPDEDEEQEPQ